MGAGSADSLEPEINKKTDVLIKNVEIHKYTQTKTYKTVFVILYIYCVKPSNAEAYIVLSTQTQRFF